MRLGLHRMSGDADDAFRRYVDAVRPPLVKFLDPGSGDEPLAAWCVARGVQVVGRVYFDDQSLGSHGGHQIGIVAAHAAACPSIKYWELHNESWHVPGEMDGYADLSVEFMDRMASMGRVAVIGCFAEGTPQVDGSDNNEAWRQYLPAIHHAIAHGHVLGLHEYSAPHMAALTEPNGLGWHTLRYRRSLAVLAGLGADVARLRIAITESGCDDIQDPSRVGPPGKGWRDYDGSEWARVPLSPHGDFAGQMAWYCRELGKDRQVIGVVDFGWASRDQASWRSFDMADTPAMVDRMIEEQRKIGGTMTDLDKLAAEAAANQRIQLNPGSGLQKAARSRGWTGPAPTSGEWKSAAGIYAGRTAQRYEWPDGRVEVATWSPNTGRVEWVSIGPK